MSVQQAFRLRKPALLMALVVVYPVLAYSAGAGSVDFSAGSVTAVNVAGIQRPLTKGAEISNGDTIRTGDGGRAQVRFSDGAMVSLQPKTEFRIDNYQFADKSDGQEKGFFSLLKGGMRTITGLIGRSNRDNYKLTTGVATIGIRGTEYTGALDPNTGDLGVHTGEGLVEVCNGAGCVLLASGESGTVSGGGGAPRRTDSRPQLPPAQLTETPLPVFSSSENRFPDGSLGPVSVPMQSGSGYAMAYAGLINGTPGISSSVEQFGTASFSQASVLQSFQGSNSSFQAANAVGGFSIDGVIGWGRWASGSCTSSGFSCAYPSPSGTLDNFHYVVGMQTSSADMTALGGLKADYALAGFTLPTSTGGIVGGRPIATLSADFSISNVQLHVGVPINGGLLTLNETGFISGSTFSGSGGSGSFAGFFGGANASYAGVGYKTPGGSVVPGEVMGVVVFKQTSTSPGACPPACP